jgi:hypothetical protein
VHTNSMQCDSLPGEDAHGDIELTSERIWMASTSTHIWASAVSFRLVPPMPQVPTDAHRGSIESPTLKGSEHKASLYRVRPSRKERGSPRYVWRSVYLLIAVGLTSNSSARRRAAIRRMNSRPSTARWSCASM